MSLDRYFGLQQGHSQLKSRVICLSQSLPAESVLLATHTLTTWLTARWKEIIFADPTTADATVTTPSLPADPLDPSHPSHGANQRIPLIPNAIAKLPVPRTVPVDFVSPLRRPASLPPGFCPECYVPQPDDPDPETLFIYLHALSYTTERLGKWSTPLPRWAGEEWDGDWRGWVDGAEVEDVVGMEAAEAAQA